MLKQIRKVIEEVSGSKDFSVSFTEHAGFGHVTSNVAMVMAKSENRNPKELASELVTKIFENNADTFAKVEVAGPGFINFTLTPDFILKSLGADIDIKSEYKSKKVLVEYTDPNPFKVFHIGHLMTNIIGEAVARIYEAAGADVKRVNYQGDIGRHIAINIYAILQNIDEYNNLKSDNTKSLVERVEWLGQMYAVGYKAFDEDADDGEIKKSVTDINKKIYEKSDETVNDIYATGRTWSLEYFETLYKKLDTKFDEYIFESEVSDLGKQTVIDNTAPLGKAVFEVGDGGAVIYDGEKVGLHKRVFLNGNGLPTYEAKDIGNIQEKIKRFGAFDKSIVITGNEQSDYFRVLYSAIDDLGLCDKNKMQHIGHGMMRFTDGKMSSRKGNIVAGDELIEDVKKILKEKFDTSRIDNETEKEETLEAVAIASLKYSILKQALGRDVVFDLEKAISVEGDSGPYLQYTYARMNSVAKENENKVAVNESNLGLVLELAKYQDVLQEVVNETAPQKLATYLVSLAREANSWYASNKVSGDESNEAIAHKIKTTLKSGLHILGIKTPSRM
jgi:arginyl-tRNA synthetase